MSTLVPVPLQALRMEAISSPTDTAQIRNDAGPAPPLHRRALEHLRWPPI